MFGVTAVTGFYMSQQCVIISVKLQHYFLLKTSNQEMFLRVLVFLGHLVFTYNTFQLPIRYIKDIFRNIKRVTTYLRIIDKVIQHNRKIGHIQHKKQFFFLIIQNYNFFELVGRNLQQYSKFKKSDRPMQTYMTCEASTITTKFNTLMPNIVDDVFVIGPVS